MPLNPIKNASAPKAPIKAITDQNNAMSAPASNMALSLVDRTLTKSNTLVSHVDTHNYNTCSCHKCGN